MNSDPDTVIRLADVTIGYDRPLLGPISLDITRGSFWGIVGPNGAGKTTLVRTAAGLMKAVSGRVEYPSGTMRFGYVPQRHVLNSDYPLNVLDVVMMGISAGKAPWGRIDHDEKERVMFEIRRAGLGDVAEKPFLSLSGGQQQQLLVARALAAGPDVLILDEPVAGMDFAAENALLAYLKRIRATSGITTLMISHQISGLAAIADRMCLMNCESGVFITGMPKEMTEPGLMSTVFPGGNLPAVHSSTLAEGFMKTAGGQVDG